MLLVPVALCAADPFEGTSKLDLAKSKDSADMPRLPNSETISFHPTEGGQKITNDQVDASGRTIHFEYDAKYDGKDYPEIGNPNVDTVSVKRVNDHATVTTNKKGGKVVMIIRAAISKDGKTRTSTMTGKDASGKSVSWTAFFEKQ